MRALSQALAWGILVVFIVIPSSIEANNHYGGALNPNPAPAPRQYTYPVQLQPAARFDRFVQVQVHNSHNNPDHVPRTLMDQQKARRKMPLTYQAIHEMNQQNTYHTNALKKVEFNNYVTQTLNRFYEFLQRNPRFCTTLESLFTRFDVNQDGKLDDTELQALERSGDLMPAQVNVIRSWDVDSSGDISSHEFTMGPLFISILETNPKRKTEYESRTMTGQDVSEMTNVFRAVAQSEPMRFQQEKFDIMGGLKKVGGAIMSGVKAVAGVVGKVAGAAMGAIGGALGGGGPAKPADPGDLRPKSKWGIPSVNDEGCVLCQYLVQRVQGELYKQLVTPEDGLPTDMNAGVSLKDIKRINERIAVKRGGKGLLRIVAEDSLADMCDSEDMPELFYPYCDSLQAKFGTMIDAIFYQFNSEAVCQENDMCGLLSYFSNPTSVHLPLQSKRFNAGRGQCGLMGGAHERPTGTFTSALCFASKMITGF